jgi:hypothetical protein
LLALSLQLSLAFHTFPTTHGPFTLADPPVYVAVIDKLLAEMSLYLSPYL